MTITLNLAVTTGNRTLRSFAVTPATAEVSLHLYASSTPAPAFANHRAGLTSADLGWTREETAAVRAQLAAFEEGWDAPDMSAYDAL